MNIIILASQNRYYLPIDEWLNDFEGVLNLFIKDSHYDTYKQIENYTKINLFPFENWDFNWNIEKQIIDIHKKNKVDKIIAIGERDIQRAAIARENLNIPGQNIESADFFRNKFIMKQYLNERNIKIPNFKLVTNYFDLNKFILENNYPIILKPIDGAASVNTFKVDNEKELKDLMSKNNLIGYLVEEFIEGEIYHIDGLWLTNKLEFLSCGRYINDSLAYKYGGSLSSVFLKKDSVTFQRLKDYTIKLLSLIPSPNSMTFHLEVFINTQNEIIFCEIASRTSGGQVAQNIEMEFGFHLTKELIRYECNLETVNFNSIKEDWDIYRGFIMSTPLKGKIVEMPKDIEFDWVTRVEKYGRIGIVCGQLNSSVQCIAAISCIAENENDLIHRLEYIDNWYKENTKYISV